MTSQPKMTDQKARLLWGSLTPTQKKEFNKMFYQIQQGNLQISYVGVDDNERVQRIVLEPKNKPLQSIALFAKHFK